MATVQEEIHGEGRDHEQAELDLVLNVLPPGVANVLRTRDDLDQLLEVAVSYTHLTLPTTPYV